MLYNIKNKEIQVIFKDEKIELPEELKEKITTNFENMKAEGKNIWNGDVTCVSSINIDDNKVEIICKKSDYAHYLYGERIGLPKEYECKNLFANSLIETIDGYYVIGELAKCTSYPRMLQFTGGNIDKKDFENNNVNLLKTIRREAKEELNIDLKDEKISVQNEIMYLYEYDEKAQPGVAIIGKSVIKMTAEELNTFFENYYKYLEENNLEIEFSKLHFIKKGNVIEELSKLDNPKRIYLLPILQNDEKENNG